MKLDVYLFELHKECAWISERVGKLKQEKDFHTLMRVIYQKLHVVLICARVGRYMCNGHGTYPHVPDEA